ncbi:MAG: hypothetical protein GPJ54_14820 [Candidatus Heimdallarchaeota archaeon]|nr:hypothetical protein [Candidatus Heimdallarchaeota archaeon]
MQVKYAVLFDSDRKPVGSYNFQDAGIPIRNEQLDQFINQIEPEMNGNLGSAQINDGADLLYYTGENTTVVLIGDELNQDILKKLSNTVNNLEKRFSDQENLPDLFTTIFYQNFHEEIIKEYHLPSLERSDTIDQISMNPEKWNFITKVDGSRSLSEISELLNLPWMEVRSIAAELYCDKFISFRVEVLYSSIYKVTTKGINILSDNSALPFDLKMKWKKIVRPIMQLIDGETSFYDIITILKKKKIDENELRLIFKLMLYEGYISSVPVTYHLALFLQKLYLQSYISFKNSIGSKIDNLQDEILKDHPDIVMMLPNFKGQRYSLDLLYHMINELTNTQIFDFIISFTKPLHMIYTRMSDIMGINLVNNVKEKLFKEIRLNNEILIRKYNLDQILI